MTPEGYWWDGVTHANRAIGAVASPAATSNPSSSTGTGTTRAPEPARAAFLAPA